jgi:hypothetical protein
MLYETDRLREKTTPREQIIYRIQVEGIVGADDHVHRFEWVRITHNRTDNQDDELRRLGIQLLNKEDLTLDQASTREEQWAYYVDSFYMHADTEGVATDMLTAPWLRRSVVITDFPQENAIYASDLQVKICLNTYKLFYLVNTEDTLVRAKTTRTVEINTLKYNRAARKADAAKWTQNGYVTKEEQNAAAAAAENREQLAAAQAALAPAESPVTAPAPSETPAPQPDTVPSTDPTPVPSVIVQEPTPASNVKLESPPAGETGDAMDMESAEPVLPSEVRSEEPKSANEDVEMTDA